MRQVNPLMQKAKKEEALGNRSNLRLIQDYHTKTGLIRVVQNERTGTAQPPDSDVAMYGDCELTTGGSASNSRIVTAHLPQETQQRKRA